MKNHRRIGVLAFFILTVMRADAQQIHQATWHREEAMLPGATGSVSYTIGQMVYNTTSGSSGTSAVGYTNDSESGQPLACCTASF